MKVEVVAKEEKAKELSYPFIGISVVDGAIVLFTDYGSGVCLFGAGNHRFGDTTGARSEWWSMEKFIPYDGKIILEND